ncbi:ABC transporter permease [Limobrevibacterium gyesilva]|uniref:ABC transporter permease n=1 Tax=Limobrevibacterium gyesilva TaxID=2991712 RepID=A0AA41YL46_9PROT|nr:ABC transporter permease [Limobrevibacterium gyesilva]MCW3475859.1 ABC transporter permease [Limobrevibacterium gyesilva]
MTRERTAGLLLITPLGLVLLLAFVAPVLLMLPTSLHGYVPGRGITPGWTLENYTALFTDSYYHEVLARTLGLGLGVTVLCLLLGYPLAFVLARLRGAAAAWVTILVVFPLLLNVVVRSFGWISLLANRGLINNALVQFGLIETPLRMMFNLTGVMVGLTHIFLPFMVLMLVAALRALPRDAEAAAAALGAGPVKTFFLVTLPLTAPGMFAGSVLVFVLSISALVTPRLLGGPTYRVMSTVIYDQFLGTLEWPAGAALAFVLTVIALLIVAVAGLVTRRWTLAR